MGDPKNVSNFWEPAQHPQKSSKSRFSEEEDKILKEVVQQNGACAWGRIALKLPGRSARQCRDRWVNYLNPTLTDKEWTEEEDKLLLNSFNQFGTHWKEISLLFKGRSLNCIRNRLFKLVRKKKAIIPMRSEKILLEETENENKSNTGNQAINDNFIFDFKNLDRELINDSGAECLEDWIVPKL